MVNVLDWFQLASNKENRMIQMRRYMHQYPEPSFEETWTHNYILNHSVILIARSNHLLAVMALKQRLKEKKWPYCGISRDFDALPVQELNDVPYKSKMMALCMRVVMTDIDYFIGCREIVHEHRHLLKGNVVLSSNMVRKLCLVVLKK